MRIARSALALVAVAAPASADTLVVGPGQPYETIAAAAAAVADGDVVEIQAGTYREAVTWSRAGVTVRGVGGRPVIDLTGMPIGNGKAIFVSAGADFTVENIEFVGASVVDQNGAGIRWEGDGSLTVRGCVFRSNEDGILGGHAGNTAVIENNEFVDNGRGDVGYTHSVYINEADAVTFRGNWSHALWPDGGDIGHLFKSRARTNLVAYNRLTAEGSPSSYEINLPQGGDAIVIGNQIHQGGGGQNTVISFGDGDGTQYTGSSLYVLSNTIVSDAGNATFVRTTQTDAEIVIINNLVVGPGTLASGGVITMHDNVITSEPGLVDAPMFDYHLVEGSPAIDIGVDPGSAGAMSLVPVEQYVHPASTQPRMMVGSAIDVGAFELGNAPSANDGVPVGGDGGSDDGDGDGDGGDGGAGGGCCNSSPQSGACSALLVALGLAFSRIRSRRNRSARRSPR